MQDNHKDEHIFETYSLGLASSRDAWVYNYALKALEHNMQQSISFYNQQRELFASKQIATVSFEATKIKEFYNKQGYTFKEKEIK